MKPSDFEHKVLPLKDKVFRFARRLMNFQTVAEDITQEVFAKLWLKRDDLSNYQNVEAFAMTVTRNMCLDHLKAKKNQNSPLEDDRNVAHSDTPLAQTQYNEQIEWLNRIIAELPEQQKTVVQLRDIEGYEFDQIEEITGMKQGTIRVNLSRARTKIREELTKVYNYGIKQN